MNPEVEIEVGKSSQMRYNKKMQFFRVTPWVKPDLSAKLVLQSTLPVKILPKNKFHLKTSPSTLAVGNMKNFLFFCTSPFHFILFMQIVKKKATCQEKKCLGLLIIRLVNPLRWLCLMPVKQAKDFFFLPEIEVRWSRGI